MDNSKTIDVVIDAPYGHSLCVGMTIYLLDMLEIKLATIKEIIITEDEKFVRTDKREKLDLLACGVAWSPCKEDLEQLIEDMKKRQLHFGDRVKIREGYENLEVSGKDGLLVYTNWPSYYNTHAKEKGKIKFLYTVAVDNVGTLNFSEDDIELIQKTNAEYYLDYAEKHLALKLRSRIYDLQEISKKKPAEIIKILNTELEDGTYLSYNKRKDK